MKYIVLAALGAAVTGFLLGWVICRRGLDGISRAQAASVTRQLFVVTLWACIAWISCSYAMAIYSMGDPRAGLHAHRALGAGAQSPHRHTGRQGALQHL